MARYLASALLGLGLLNTPGADARALPRAPADAVTVAYEFPNNTWLENLAMRANGDVLTTVLTAPELYLLPAADGLASAHRVYSFPEATALSGITEVCPDEFVVSVGNYSATTGFVPGSFSAWRVAFAGPHGRTATAHKIADLHLFPNGATTLNAAAGVVLLGDSTHGKIHALDVRTGAQRVVLEHPSMKIAAGSPYQFGSNGVRVHVAAGRTFVYYDNTSKDLLVRVPVDPRSGEAVGPYEVMPLPAGSVVDDLAVAPDGTVYVTGDPTNLLLRVAPDGTAEKILGGPRKRVLMGATAAVFGRRPGDERTLYVSTNGGMLSPESGPYHGGEIVRIEVDRL